MTRTTARACAAAFLLLTACVAHAGAQQILVRGRGDIEHDVFLRRLSARRDLTIVTQQRGLAAGDTIRGDVLVTGKGRLDVDGVITGDLIIVDGSVFLRPSARVLGGVRNIAGGLFASELARVSGEVQSAPNAPYIAEPRADGTVVIIGTTTRSMLRLESPRNLVPAYDRVNGVTLTLGAHLLLPRVGLLEPSLRGRVQYASQRGAGFGGGELAVARRRTELAFGAERSTLTNERWIRSDLNNSLAALARGKDYRDYYEADRFYAEVRRLLEQRARVTSVYLRAQVEDARTLRAADPWSVTGEFRADNISFADSRITSVVFGGESAWVMPLHVFEINAATEVGMAAIDGEHSFARYYIDSEWAMAALRDHTLKIETHFQGPLPGTDSLPGQRWSFVGGSGTLYTFDIAQFRGDRIGFVKTTYSIPLSPRLRLGPLGTPSLDLLHLAGMARSNNVTPRFEQNVGARIAYDLLYVRVVTNPRDLADDAEFSLGVRFPPGAYPWQAPR